jgi:FAD binding domain
VNQQKKLPRRDFISRASGLTASGLVSGCLTDHQKIDVIRPGMSVGHAFRAGIHAPAWQQMSDAGSIECDVAIIGSGAAGLMAAWQLRKAGVTNLCILQGPTPHGNAAGTQVAGLACPTAAHYLPLPSIESGHVRALLHDMQVLQGPVNAPRPSYAEAVLVHAPSERLFHNGKWHSSILPFDSVPPEERQGIQRFLDLTRRLSEQLGADNKRIFVVPIVLASTDPKWRALDTMTFAAWLDTQGYDGAALRWYLDYCCKDEFGAGISTVSAWAGLHYFCSRNGHAANAPDGTVLTWSAGLAPLLAHMQAGIQPQQLLPLTAMHLRRQQKSVVVLATDSKTKVTITARKVIVATPLFIAQAIDPEIRASFASTQTYLPNYQPWLVSNFYFDRAPAEAANTELSWDNVIYGSQSLGFVNATAQLIRRNPRPATVLTAYHAFAAPDTQAARQWCANATQEQLLNLASTDLVAAYGAKAVAAAAQVQINVHGHGMASPRPGFLDNPMTTALRQESGSVLYAHSDLSGYSVFEEATWWGQRAAHCCIS